ncbi:hypothetical protein PO909_029238 [Leuciscus waleckii]
MLEPTPGGAIKPDITSDPEGSAFDQVCEPTEPSIVVGILMEASPAHPPATESQSQLDLKDSVDVCGEMSSLCPFIMPKCEIYIFSRANPTQPPSPTTSRIYHLECFFVGFYTLLQSPLQPSATPATQSSLSPIRSSVPPQPPLSGKDTPREPSPPRREDLVALPPASEHFT